MIWDGLDPDLRTGGTDGDLKDCVNTGQTSLGPNEARYSCVYMNIKYTYTSVYIYLRTAPVDFEGLVSRCGPTV